MASDPRDTRLIDDLVAGLRPVRRRRAGRDFAVLALLAALQAGLYASLAGMRPDMDTAMADPAFWWKAASLGLLAVLGAMTAVRSFDPAASPRRGLRVLGVAAALVVAAGWAVDAARGGAAVLLARLDPMNGLSCVFTVVGLSLPAILALGLLMRRGAPTDPRGTAAAVGLTAAAWGGFVFVIDCPHDDPLYVVLWFATAIAAVGLLARLVLPRLTRW